LRTARSERLRRSVWCHNRRSKASRPHGIGSCTSPRRSLIEAPGDRRASLLGRDRLSGREGRAAPHCPSGPGDLGRNSSEVRLTQSQGPTAENACSFPELTRACVERLFQLGPEVAHSANARSRLRSCRRTAPSWSQAFWPVGRQGHLVGMDDRAKLAAHSRPSPHFFIGA
jgi:hypothetical protein